MKYAAKTGRLLAEAKSKCEHGTWRQWVADNCRFSLRTGQLYMRIARELPKAQHVARLSLREAAKLLRKPESADDVFVFVADWLDRANAGLRECKSTQDELGWRRRYDLSAIGARLHTLTSAWQSEIDSSDDLTRLAQIAGMGHRVQNGITEYRLPCQRRFVQNATELADAGIDAIKYADGEVIDLRRYRSSSGQGSVCLLN